MDVDIWSDLACPWCFIGKRRFERGLADVEHRNEIQVTWHSYQLDPNLPDRYDGTEVDYLSARKGMAPDQVRQMFQVVETAAREEGLAYDFDRLVVANSRPGHELLHHAQAHGVASQVKDALLSAHFEQGRDIGDRDVLTQVGTDAGLDPAEIRAALDDGRYRDAVRADIEQARAIGVTSVPFVVIGRRYAVVGAQPAAVFRDALTRAYDESHAPG